LSAWELTYSCGTAPDWSTHGQQNRSRRHRLRLCSLRHPGQEAPQIGAGVFHDAIRQIYHTWAQRQKESPGIGSIRRLGKETRAAGLGLASRPFQRMALRREGHRMNPTPGRGNPRRGFGPGQPSVSTDGVASGRASDESDAWEHRNPRRGFGPGQGQPSVSTDGAAKNDGRSVRSGARCGRLRPVPCRRSQPRCAPHAPRRSACTGRGRSPIRRSAAPTRRPPDRNARTDA